MAFIKGDWPGMTGKSRTLRRPKHTRLNQCTRSGRTPRGPDVFLTHQGGVGRAAPGGSRGNDGAGAPRPARAAVRRSFHERLLPRQSFFLLFSAGPSRRSPSGTAPALRGNGGNRLDAVCPATDLTRIEKPSRPPCRHAAGKPPQLGRKHQGTPIECRARSAVGPAGCRAVVGQIG